MASLSAHFSAALGRFDAPHTYKLVVRPDASQNQTHSFRRPELHPRLLMLGVNGRCEVGGPLYACGFGIPVVDDVVNVT